MLKRLVIVGWILIAVMAVPLFAQKATEVFIPIGDSPGVSGKYSVTGRIDSVDASAGVMTVSSDAGEHRVRITEKTKIWLDRSAAKKTNGSGSPADCRPGRLCEVKFVYEGENRTDEAEWIKIRAE